MILCVFILVHAGEVVVKCSKTGRKIKTQVEEKITKKIAMSLIVIKDFFKGSIFIAEVNGKLYPVEFLEIMGMLLNFVCMFAYMS